MDGVELAIREITQQLDILIDNQQKLSSVIKDIPTEDKPDVMKQQDHIICGCMKLNRKIDPALALALAIQSQLWSIDNAYELWKSNPWCPEDEFDYSFEQYASCRTLRDPITIVNWIRTAKTWLIDKIGPEGEIPIIDPKTGQVLLEQINGQTKPIMKKWDPTVPDFSKLLLVNKKAENGQLDNIAFGMLLNPECRWHDIRDYIHGIIPWARKPSEEHTALSFFIQNALLYAKRGGESAIIGSLELESENPIANEGLARLVKILNASIII